MCEDVEVIGIRNSWSIRRAALRHVVFDVIVDGVEHVFTPAFQKVRSFELRSRNSLKIRTMTNTTICSVCGFSAFGLGLRKNAVQHRLDRHLRPGLNNGNGHKKAQKDQRGDFCDFGASLWHGSRFYTHTMIKYKKMPRR